MWLIITIFYHVIFPIFVGLGVNPNISGDSQEFILNLTQHEVIGFHDLFSFQHQVVCTYAYTSLLIIFIFLSN